MAKYNVGIIGCGGIAKSHANAWQAIDDVELVAGVDIDKDTLSAFCMSHKIPRGYTDTNEMLEKEKLDFVSICTWTGLHAEQTIAAAQAGIKGVLCEKPMSYDLESCDRMIEACEKAGVKLAIGQQRRYMPQWIEGQRLIREGAIGQPMLIYWGAGGGLLNIGCHAVGAFRQLMSDEEVRWVVGQAGRKTDRYERGTRIEDFCMFIFSFDSGARAIGEFDLPDYEERKKRVDELNPICVGTEGQLAYFRNGLKLWAKGQGEWRDVKVEGENASVAQAKALIKWVEGGPEHHCSARKNRKTIELLMAVYESMRTRDIVHLPLKVTKSPLLEMIDDGSLPVQIPGKYDIRAKKKQK